MMVDKQAGKGDTFRPVDKKKYDYNYLHIFGEACPICGGTGLAQCVIAPSVFFDCPICDGIGYVEKKK